MNLVDPILQSEGLPTEPLNSRKPSLNVLPSNIHGVQVENSKATEESQRESQEPNIR